MAKKRKPTLRLVPKTGDPGAAPDIEEGEETIGPIVSNEISPAEKKILAADRRRRFVMGEAGSLDNWLAFGPGLQVRRRVAMARARTNKPRGTAYNRCLKELLEADGLDTMESQSRTAILWLHDAPERLETLREILDTMPAGNRMRLRTPISAKQKVEERLQIGHFAPEKVAKRAAKREEREAQKRADNDWVRTKEKEIEGLRKQLNAAKSGDYDFERTSGHQLAEQIIRKMGALRATDVRDALTELLVKATREASKKDKAKGPKVQKPKSTQKTRSNQLGSANQ
jgi:hypothetical protein